MSISVGNAIGCALSGMAAYTISFYNLEVRGPNIPPIIQDEGSELSNMIGILACMMPYYGELFGGTSGMIAGYIGSVTVMSIPCLTKLAVENIRANARRL